MLYSKLSPQANKQTGCLQNRAALLHGTSAYFTRCSPRLCTMPQHDTTGYEEISLTNRGGEVLLLCPSEGITAADV